MVHKNKLVCTDPSTRVTWMQFISIQRSSTWLNAKPTYLPTYFLLDMAKSKWKKSRMVERDNSKCHCSWYCYSIDLALSWLTCGKTSPVEVPFYQPKSSIKHETKHLHHCAIEEKYSSPFPPSQSSKNGDHNLYHVREINPTSPILTWTRSDILVL